MPLDRLIVIAGPKAAGKSLLMTRLQQQSLPHLAEAIQMGDPGSWQYRAGKEFQDDDERARIRDSGIERLMLHYEITGPWDPGHYARSFVEDKPLELLGFFNEITVLTLWAPCDVLLNRFLARNPRFSSKLVWLRFLYWHGFHLRKFDSDFRPLYRNPEGLLQIYVNWIRFCHINLAKAHWLVDSGNERYSHELLGQSPGDLHNHINGWSKERSGVPAYT